MLTLALIAAVEAVVYLLRYRSASQKCWMRSALHGFLIAATRVVCRFYEHPMVRELYPEPRWVYHAVEGGKKQSNGAAPELLITNTNEAADAAGDTQ